MNLALPTLTRYLSAWYTTCMETLSQDAFTNLDLITAQEQPLPVQVVEPLYPPLTQDEDTFALAIIESSGNVAAAYKMVFGIDSHMPLAKGKELLSKPGIALRIREITDSIQEASLISVGAHLQQMATIRDLAIVTGQLKVAYSAERARGEAVGIYQKHDAANKNKGGTQAVQINISMASKHDVNI